MGRPMDAPLGKLEYLYVGSSDFERDLAYYRDVLKADHRPAPTCMPVYAVKDLGETVKSLKRRGWKPDGGRFEIPNGPCYAFEDPSKNRFAIFENVRPNVFR
jgi:hypothetical protein